MDRVVSVSKWRLTLTLTLIGMVSTFKWRWEAKFVGQIGDACRIFEESALYDPNLAVCSVTPRE